MIKLSYDDIFDSEADTLTNTINIVGVMGKGLALEFKQRYPDMFKDYKSRCNNGLVIMGEPYLYKDKVIKVLNFPTKNHWRDKSNIKDIEKGLAFLSSNYKDMDIKSLALPPLGCGLGGLNWKDVRPLVYKYLDNLEIDVIVYEPSSY